MYFASTELPQCEGLADVLERLQARLAFGGRRCVSIQQGGSYNHADEAALNKNFTRRENLEVTAGEIVVFRSVSRKY